MGAPSTRDRPISVWTGTELIIWGGYNVPRNVYVRDGFIYRPSSDSWRPMTTNGAPAFGERAVAIWTGAEMLVWGGFGQRALNTGGAYNPGKDQWRPITTLGAPSARWRHSAVWTGAEMILWGGESGDFQSTVFNTGGRYSPSTDTWSNTPTMGAPLAAAQHAAIWTGTEMILWGGISFDGISTVERSLD